ncbi:MAG TPA: flavoprotein [Thermoanaerobaculia bacterium]|nr:flavoprotein [Thermoanaerobaculia bacterium]
MSSAAQSTGAGRRPRLAILGAGPIGLEAALAAAEAGLPFTLYEAGPEVAASVRAWGHVRLFTPWAMDVSPRMRRHLAAAGAAPPDDGERCPTGRELASGLCDRVAALPQVAPRLRLCTRVLAVGREGLLKHEEIATAERGRRPFRLLLAGQDGEQVEHAEVVIDATGSYGHPNSLGDGGIPAPGERLLAGEIRRGIPDLAREAGDWAGRTVLLAGAGASAQTAARGLAELARSAPGTHVVWALRRAAPSWGSPANDPLPERAGLAAAAAELAGGASPAVTAERGVVVERLERAGPGGRVAVTLRRAAGEGGGNSCRQVTVDRVLSLTGGVGDHQLYRQLQVHECYATCGPIKLSAALLGAAAGDCLEQTSHGVEALANPEPGFYILGSKSYGRNNTFLLRTGWQQVAEVFATLPAGP